MDRKELFMNVRKAYRLAYEVQDSIVEIVEYIRTKINYEDCAGKQLFSGSVRKRKGVGEGYVTDNIGGGMWSWDYFPTYMYIYYFDGIPTETQNCCFSIVQVMDDGFKIAPIKYSSPSTKYFRDSADSESYLLFSFSIQKKDHRNIWFEYDGTEVIRDEGSEILRISDDIKNKGNEPYIKKTGDACFIVAKISLEAIGSKAEADQALQYFSKLVREETGYHLLIDETQEGSLLT